MKIKDPVHGYIEIDDELTKNIIDTSNFQRLREVRQTNYYGLYPGSLHNRFIHSLGVYFLGKRAIVSFENNLKNLINESNIDNISVKRDTFLIACLLHDVGHAPFSHTGENFYLMKSDEDNKYGLKAYKGKVPWIYTRLLESVQNYLGCNIEDFKNDDFYKDFVYRVSNPPLNFKPHEVMSVIIGLNTYSEFFKYKRIDGALFARMIIGLQIGLENYETSNFKKESVIPSIDIDITLQNALISLLNSELIDVDKLDYLLRDTQMTGFDNMAIDIERLLDSFILYKDIKGDQNYHFAYKKSALSTLENVMICYDSERKWIQNQPVIKYESFLFNKCIEVLNKKFREKIFVEESLSDEGHAELDYRLSLLSDADIIFLLKQVNSNDFLEFKNVMNKKNVILEFFDRNRRKKAIWKSEHEFNLFMAQFNDDERECINKIFIGLIGSPSNEYKFDFINDEFIEVIQNSIKENVANYNKPENAKKKVFFEGKITHLLRVLFWCIKFKELCDSLDTDFDVTHIEVDAFVSKLDRMFVINPMIYFNSFNVSKGIKSINSLYTMQKATEGINNKFFYLFIHKNEKYSIDKIIEFFKNTIKDFNIVFKNFKFSTFVNNYTSDDEIFKQLS